MAQTGIDKKQLKNWFTNARRRIPERAGIAHLRGAFLSNRSGLKIKKETTHDLV